MTSQPSRARLLNSDHELIAEGTCLLDEPAGQASLEVDRTTGVIQNQHGNLSLELDSGRSLLVSDKPIVLMITPPGEKPSPLNRRKIFRLRLVDPMAAIIEEEASSAEPDEASDAGAQGFPRATNHLTQDASPSFNSGAAAAGAMPAPGRDFSSTNLTQDAPRSIDVGAAAAQGLPVPEYRTPGSTNLTQDASAVGAAGKGRPAVSRMGRLPAQGRGETPAAR